MDQVEPGVVADLGLPEAGQATPSGNHVFRLVEELSTRDLAAQHDEQEQHVDAVGGGDLQYGTAAGASCAPMIKVGGQSLYAIRFYAKSAEIPFGLLRNRKPFDDPALREELRQRLNDAPGIDIPVAKLELYPPIKNTQLASVAVFDVVVAVLDWFMAKVTVPVEEDG